MRYRAIIAGCAVVMCCAAPLTARDIPTNTSTTRDTRLFGDLKNGEEASVTPDDFCIGSQSAALMMGRPARPVSQSGPSARVRRQDDSVVVTLQVDVEPGDTRGAMRHLTRFLSDVHHNGVCADLKTWPVKGVGIDGLHIVHGSDGRAQDFEFRKD